MLRVCLCTIHTKALSVQTQYGRLCPTEGSSRYYGSLDTCTVVHVTASNFKLLIFSVSGFTLSNIANIFDFYILNEFCLLPEEFCFAGKNPRSYKIRKMPKLSIFHKAKPNTEK